MTPEAKWAVAQMALLRHGEAPEGWVAEPIVETSSHPSWREIETAIRQMDDVLFAVILSVQHDLACLFDPNALVVEHGAGKGFWLHLMAPRNDRSSNAGRFRSRENVSERRDLDIDDVLRIVCSFCSGAGLVSVTDA